MMFDFIGKFFFSRKMIMQTEDKLKMAGYSYSGDEYLGFEMIMGLLISLIFLVILEYKVPIVHRGFVYQVGFLLGSGVATALYYILAIIGSFMVGYFIVFLLADALISLGIEHRAKKVESVLPDYLLMVTSNLKAGMPIEQAMIYSAKPEFGVFSKDVKDVMKKTYGGTTSEKALYELSHRYKSRALSRVVELITQAMKSGGELGPVLVATAKDVRESIVIRKDAAASLMQYQIFLLFAAALGTPFLFATAEKLIGVFETQQISAPASGSSALFTSMPISISKLPISSVEFNYFSLAMIVVTTFFSSLILGAIKSGDEKDGLKYFIPMLIVAYVVYYILLLVFSMIFKGMMH